MGSRGYGGGVRTKNAQKPQNAPANTGGGGENAPIRVSRAKNKLFQG